MNTLAVGKDWNVDRARPDFGAWGAVQLSAEQAIPDVPGYHVIRELGRGGMAMVYLATQDLFERKVALKLMLPATASDPEFGRRFFREARIIGQLNHPHIVPVHEVGEHAGRYFLSMEYLPAGDLSSRIDDGMSVSDVLVVVTQVAEALAFAHDHGVVHRDVKPDNILFRGSKDAVLTDFGIARDVDDRGDVTIVESVVGSPRYMSPEQARGRSVDARTDIFSLGVVLFEMLTGRVPFDGDTAAAVVDRQMQGSAIRLSGEERIFEPVLARMIALEPQHRFANARALLQALGEIRAQVAQGGLQAVEPLVPNLRPRPSRISRWRDALSEFGEFGGGGGSPLAAAVSWTVGLAALLLVVVLLTYLLWPAPAGTDSRRTSAVDVPPIAETKPVSGKAAEGAMPGDARLIDLDTGEAVSRGSYRDRPRAGIAMLAPGFYLYDMRGKPIEEFDQSQLRPIVLPTPDQVYRYADIVAGRIDYAGGTARSGREGSLFDEILAIRDGSRDTLDSVRRRAALGEVAAQVVLSEVLNEGWQTRSDPRRALDLAGQAARHGYALAHYQAGVLLLQNERDATREAEQHLRAGVDAGFFLAMTTLGDQYWKTGEPGRMREAVTLYRAAAAQGDREAMFKLASLILEHEPRHGSRFEALSYLHRAVASGHVEAGILLEEVDASPVFDGG